jgi:hypothetical protein
LLDDYLQFLEYLRYSPRDVIHFSAGTYHRLFGLYNAEIFPAQVAGLALTAAAIGLAIAGRPRMVAAILALCWLWIAWMFHGRHLATIHLGGGFIAVCWAVQAALLAWRGTRLRFDGPRWPGLALCFVALAEPPLAILAGGRTWAEIELAGTAPDATAIATLGLVLMARGRPAWSLLVLPLAWCAVTGATLWAMRLDAAAMLPWAAGGAALLLATGKIWSLPARAGSDSVA